MGWPALVLAVYNLIRWYAARSYYAERRAEREQWTRQQARIRTPPEPPREPDPNFIFTDPPPQPGNSESKETQ